MKFLLTLKYKVLLTLKLFEVAMCSAAVMGTELSIKLKFYVTGNKYLHST